MRKGQFYKVVGGDFGVFWNGRHWARFECLCCAYALEIIKPGNRLSGPPSPKADFELRFGPPKYLHDIETHKKWIAMKAAANKK